MTSLEISKADFDAYLKRLEASIADAEQHLAVPHGTLASILNDSDYIAILKMHATVEPLLNELLEKNVLRVLSHPKVSFPGGDTLAEFILKRNIDEKRTLALKFELISSTRATFIRRLTETRNHYAHNIKNASLLIGEIAKKISPKDDGLVVMTGLCGSVYKSGSPAGRDLFYRTYLHYSFAGFLHEAMPGINPPPAQPILSGLFEPGQ